MRLGDTAFFNLFATLAAAGNSNRDRDRWEYGGVHWARERHIHWGADVSFQLETYILHHRGPPRAAWDLLVTTEIWWASDRKRAFRHGHWAHLSNGSRVQVLRWFAGQQAAL